ncbi:MAG TPA: ferrochelatase [Streptosporangiaceae bacterium]|nr:ferrochelatase [Streptosporangiaceae bacterium]
MSYVPDYDAFLLVSFGGPEGPDDVMPYLENVTRGRGIPRERLAAVAEHYYAYGGVSPINQQCRDIIAAVRDSFDAAGLRLPVYWGNRNWKPYLTDTVREMAADGVQRAIAFVTSAYSSCSSCRQYLDDIGRARAQAGPGAPAIDKIRHYFNHPGFIGPFAENARAALATLPPGTAAGAHLVFTAHSIPCAMAAASGPPGRPVPGYGGRYTAELTEASRLIAERVDGGTHPWELVYQSRSGPPSQPWLEPDVQDHLAELARSGASSAVLIPVGFVSDHMEVRHDLDAEAAEVAASLGLPLARAATPWNHPAFAAMITELVMERLGGAGGTPAVMPRAALGGLGPAPDTCPAGCCEYPRPAPGGAGRITGAAGTAAGGAA